MSSFVSKEELQERYSRHSDFELLDIIGNKQNYTPIAIEVAKEEIKKRNLSTKHIDTYNDVVSRSSEAAYETAIEELGTGDKIFYFFSSMLGFLIVLLMQRHLIEKGLEYKSRQARYYALYGILTLALTAIISFGFGLEILFFPLIIGGFFLTLKLEKKFVEKSAYFYKDIDVKDLQ